VALAEVSGRELIHTRKLDMRVFRRSDELYDVDAHLLDVKPFVYPMPDVTRAANEPIHDMWLRLTLDARLVIRHVDALMDTGAHTICHEVCSNFQRLVGLSIGKGFNGNVRQRLGGGEGCTHLVEMLAQVATTVLQAMWAEREMRELAEGKAPRIAPGVIDTCYTYRRDSVYVREHFNDFFESTVKADEDTA
jgi:hypothetical protein